MSKIKANTRRHLKALRDLTREKPRRAKREDKVRRCKECGTKFLRREAICRCCGVEGEAVKKDERTRARRGPRADDGDRVAG